MVDNGHGARDFETDTTKAKTTAKYALVALAALATASLLAQYGVPGERTTHATVKSSQQQANALESLRSRLGLSDLQVQQLNDLSRQNRAETQATSERIRSRQTTLHELENSSVQPDENAADRLVAESTSLRAQLQESQQDLAQKATAILTPGQQHKLADLSLTVRAQRQASPQAMPEAWPLIHAAAQLGLIAPSARAEGMG